MHLHLQEVNFPGEDSWLKAYNQKGKKDKGNINHISKGSYICSVLVRLHHFRWVLNILTGICAYIPVVELQHLFLARHFSLELNLSSKIFNLPHLISDFIALKFWQHCAICQLFSWVSAVYRCNLCR